MTIEPVEVALWYAESLGWAVLPIHNAENGVCTCGTINCRSAGKHPRIGRGVNDASSDRQQILDWWRQWPDANIAVACGAISGIIVVDVDPRNGGRISLKEFSSQPPKDVWAKTGGGGAHYFCEYTDEAILHKPAPGIDVQGDGRYVVIYPSIHESGKQYKWKNKPKRNKRFGALPDWALASSSEGEDGAADRLPKKADVIRSGNRNDVLYRWCCRLRRYGSTEAEIYAWATVRNRMWFEPPLDDIEVKQIARSAARQPVTDPDTIRSEFDQTATGNAKLMIHLHGDMVAFSPSLGWLVWQDTHWATEEQSRVTPHFLAEGIGRWYQEMLAREDDDKAAKALENWIKTCHSAQGINDIVKRSEQQPEMRKFAYELDADGWLFNVLNGTIDLRSGDLLAHRKDDYITKIAPVTYDAKAQAPRFMQFLQETFQGDQELIDYIQRLLGYCLTGATTEQIFPVFWGVGGNGKSKLLEDALGGVMGKDYRVTLSADTLMDNRFTSSKRDAELMNLRGARLAIASESKKRSLDEEMIKKLTGEDTITAKRLYKNPEEFKPTHKLILITNNKPRASNSEAIWRRLRLVPFTYKVPAELVDGNLGDKLKAEASGILNWLIEGCLQWQILGLQEPEAVIATTAHHREDQDLLGAFFREAVYLDAKAKCAVNDLFLSYEMWCSDAGIRPLGKINFSRAVLERFASVKRYMSNGQAKFKGIKPMVTIKHHESE